jgi:hypothetical protein
MTKAPTEAEAIADGTQSSTARGFTAGLLEVETPGEESFHVGCGGYIASGGRQAGRVCVDCGAVVDIRVFVRMPDGRRGWARREAFLRGRP